MSNAVDAVNELIRAQKLRIQVTDHVSYQVRAPGLLAQLEAELGASSGRGSVTGVAGSRILIAADAWDLWAAITTSAHSWAEHLGIDRRPYRQPSTVAPRPAPRERIPDWMTALAAWVRPVAWDQPPESPVADPPVPSHQPDPELQPRADRAGAARRLGPLHPDEHTPFPDIPPIGKLLRGVAAQAVTRDETEIAFAVARSATRWAGQIRTLLGQLDVDERVWPIRGAACEDCGATTVIDERDDGHYRVPALQARLLQRVELWPYLICLACGANGWLSFTATPTIVALQAGRIDWPTPPAATAPPPPKVCDCACHAGGAFRPACTVPGGCGSIGCDARGYIRGKVA